MNNASLMLLLLGLPLFTIVGCSGGGSEGTSSGAPYNVSTPRPDASPAFIDDPSLGCLANVYDRPAQELLQTDLNPPAWMLGNWTGQRDKDHSITIVATVNNVAFGSSEQNQQASIDDGPGKREIVELQSTNQTYSYAVVDTVENSPVAYTHEYTFIDSDHIRYSLSSNNYLDESIVMRSQNSSEIINPPSWLLGEWRNERCETRLFDSGDIAIEYDNGDPTISFAEILSGAEATFQTRYSDDSVYEIVATYLSSDGMQRLRFQELYVLLENGTVKHITAGRIQTLIRR